MARPGPNSQTNATLEGMREVQAYNWPGKTPGATAPDLCLAAANFLVGKLAGLYPRAQHLNGFLASPEAKSLAQTIDIKSAFGKLNALDIFNQKVLPQAIAWGKIDGAPKDVEFVHQWGNASKGDELLKAAVPLVVGVSLSDDGSRDHFITLVTGGKNAIWAVDSWGPKSNGSVVQLPEKMTFTKAVRMSMNAGPTTIPCGKSFFGYYREKGNDKGLRIAVAL